MRRCLRPALAAQRGEERATVCRGIIIPAARIGFSYHVRETFMYVFTFLPWLAVMWCHTARESARLSLVE